MARPIQATPKLTGRDAREFRIRMDAAVMTPERLQWLQEAAEESKAAEKSKK